MLGSFEGLRCDECEGCDVNLYRANFCFSNIVYIKNIQFQKLTLYSHASHSSLSSHSASSTVPSSHVDAFLREWFGLHAGREVLHPSPKERVFLEKVEDLVFHIEVCKSCGFPSWMSVQPFRARDLIFGLEKLFFDFDSKADPPDLEKAWNEAYDFCLKLEKYYGVKSLIVFSGRKGYHVYVFLWTTVEVPVGKEDLAKQIYAQIQEKLLKGLSYENLDHSSIGDIKRLSRIPYSVHEKTSRTCQPLSLERHPLWLGPKDLHRLREHGIHRDFFEKVCKEATSSNAKRALEHRSGFKPRLGNKVRPCITQALSNNDLPHLMRLAIVAEHLHTALPIGEIVSLFQSQSDFNPEKTQYMIQHALKRGYKPRKCSTIQGYGFCLHEACPIFKRRTNPSRRNQ